MNAYLKNGDVSGGFLFMKSHTLFEANNQNTIDYKKKRGVTVPNVS